MILVENVNNAKKAKSSIARAPRGHTGTYAAINKYGHYTQGGYASHIVVTEAFVVHIPESIPLEKAASLLCAGITTYSPLNH